MLKSNQSMNCEIFSKWQLATLKQPTSHLSVEWQRDGMQWWKNQERAVRSPEQCAWEMLFESYCFKKFVLSRYLHIGSIVFVFSCCSKDNHDKDKGYEELDSKTLHDVNSLQERWWGMKSPEREWHHYQYQYEVTWARVTPWPSWVDPRSPWPRLASGTKLLRRAAPSWNEIQIEERTS